MVLRGVKVISNLSVSLVVAVGVNANNADYLVKDARIYVSIKEQKDDRSKKVHDSDMHSRHFKKLLEGVNDDVEHEGCED